MKKIFFVILIIIFFLIASLWFFLKERKINISETEDFSMENSEESDLIIEKTEKNDTFIEEKVEKTKINNEKITALPASIKIGVPFTAQAPFGVWDEKHEEACEEASLLMMVKYVSNGNLTPETSEKELQTMIDFQIANYGDYKDSNMEEIVQLAKDFYELDNLKVVYDFKKEEIKKELAKGNPVIVPTAGRLLGNPYFTPPGPLYHNLILTGYDGDIIIANDPGTKRGAGYNYDINILFDAVHDFTGKKEDIRKGRKAMIVISF